MRREIIRGHAQVQTFVSWHEATLLCKARDCRNEQLDNIAVGSGPQPFALLICQMRTAAARAAPFANCSVEFQEPNSARLELVFAALYDGASLENWRF